MTLFTQVHGDEKPGFVSPSPVPGNFYYFSEEEKKEVAATLGNKSQQPFTEQNIDAYVNYASGPGGLVFKGINKLAAELRSGQNRQGFILLRNLPLDALNGMTKQSALSELQLLCAAQLFGAPFNYINRRGSTLIENLIPVKEDSDQQLGTNSVELFWHTEDAHQACSPDFIALFCLRGDPDAHTMLSCIHETELDAGLVADLLKPDFIISPDNSVTKGNNSAPCPILDLSGTGPVFRFDPLYTSCTNKQAEAVLDKMIKHLNANAVSVQLKAGDMLIIDNRRCVHARTAFTPRYQGDDRWVQRLLYFDKQIGNNLLDATKPYMIKA